jgi:hypothetical protein
MQNKKEVTEKLTAMGVEFDPNAHIATLNKVLRDAEAKVTPTTPEKIELQKFVASEEEVSVQNDAVNDMADRLATTLDKVSNEPFSPSAQQLDPTIAALRANAAAVQSVRTPTWVNIKSGKEQQRYHQLERPNKSVDIKTDDGTWIRNYSLEIHGKNYAQLAKQFCDKKNSQIR